jgi:P27 family predicted phage terminase small subunit
VQDVMRNSSGTRGPVGKPLELLAQTETRPGRIHDPVVLSAKLDPLHLPEPPEDMPEEGVTLWKRAIPWLVQVNVIQEIDLTAFEQMCRIYATAESARKVLDEQGYFALGSGGQITEHPAVKVWQTSQMMFLRHAGEFGMTTMARTRLGLMDVQRKSIQQDLDWTLGPSTRAAEG